jgi:hypothetical protein
MSDRCRWLFLLCLCLSTFQAFAGLTREGLNAHYRGFRGFSGTAMQSRSSPYLLKPLRSEVHIAYQNEKLSWQAQGQEKLEVSFPDTGPPQFAGGSTVTAGMPDAVRVKLLATLKAMRRLMLIDPKLDEDFVVIVKGQQLLITPRSKQSDIFFQEIVLVFDQSLQLQSMQLKAQDDVTELTFSQLKWVK